MALTLEDVNCIIKDAQPELLRRLDLNLLLQAELECVDVITEALKNELQAIHLTPYDKIAKLLNSIKTGPVKRFLYFCKTLEVYGQEHLLKIMGVEINQIEMQLATLQPTRCSTITAFRPTGLTHDGQDLSLPAPLTDRSTMRIEQDLRETVTVTKSNIKQNSPFSYQKEYYKSKLANSPIYEYTTRSPSVHVDSVYTKIQLIDNQGDGEIMKDPTKRKPISFNDMFKYDGKTLSILLEGKSGIGKSTLMRHWAVDWAKRQRHGTDPTEHASNIETSSFYDIELLIHKDKLHEGHTFEETIRNAIEGSENQKDSAMHFSKEKPESKYLFVDALDEFLNVNARDEILQLAQSGSINVLVSCRLEHPYLESKMNCFNRHVVLEGFDRDDIETFMRKYMKVLSAGNDNSEAFDIKCKRLSEVLKRTDAQIHYTCPMNCALLCNLYHSGEILDKDLPSLTFRDLYEKQQPLMLKRELIKAAGLNEEQRDRIEKEVQATKDSIYRMALLSLDDERTGKSSYTEEEVQSKGINTSSPAMVLLRMGFEHSAGGPRKVFSWPHQKIKEFQAANAMMDTTVMNYLAAEPKLIFITKLIVPILVDRDPELAQDFLATVLLLQSTDPPCTQRAPDSSTSSSLSHEHACSAIPKLRTACAGLDGVNIAAKLNLKEIHACLCGTDWMVKNMKTLFLIQAIAHDSQIFADVVHPFLPSVSPQQDPGRSSFDKNPLTCIVPWEGRLPCLVLLITRKTFGYNALVMGSKLLTPLERIVGYPKTDTKFASTHQAGCSEPQLNEYTLYNVKNPRVTGILEQFAQKCGRVARLKVAFEVNGASPGNEVDENESSIWKDAIVRLHEIFKPSSGITLSPSYDEILAPMDILELTQSGIELSKQNFEW